MAMQARKRCRARALRASAGLFVLATCGGCAVDGLGAVAARIDRADGALVYTTYAPGLSLRTRAEERGVALGYTERTCIAALTPKAPPTGLYVGRLPPYPAHCYARQFTAWGSELRTSAPDFSISLGYRDSLTLARVSAGEVVSYDLEFDTNRPSQTHLEVHTP